MDLIDRYKKWRLTHSNESDSESESDSDQQNNSDDSDWNMTIKGSTTTPYIEQLNDNDQLMDNSLINIVNNGMSLTNSEVSQKRTSPVKEQRSPIREIEPTQQQNRRSLSPQKSPNKESPTRSLAHTGGVAKSDLNISRSMESSRNSRSMENLDQHVPQHQQPRDREVRSNNKSSSKTSSDKSRRSKDPEPDAPGPQVRKQSSSSNKKENRKSTGSAVMTPGSAGSSPSRSNEKSGSGGKRRGEHPSGVGAIGGRGSILHNTVNPLLTELHHRYNQQRPSSSEPHDSIEELRNAFELAERSSPGITEHFIQLIFTRLHPNGSEDRSRSYVDRLTRVTKS